jgi:hypothetical protein
MSIIDGSQPTSFLETLRSRAPGLSDLNPDVHPYVVFGTNGDNLRSMSFDPRVVGIMPLSIMAVVCDDKLVSLTVHSRTNLSTKAALPIILN